MTYQEICDEFNKHGYSSASATALLSFSPLPKNIGYGLYTNWGNEFTNTEYANANERRERIPANQVINYTQNGEIIFLVNIGVWGLRGTIMLSGLETLEGKWKAVIKGEQKEYFPTVNEGYIYGLEKPLEKMGAKIGNRIQMKFDVENRIVTLSKAVKKQ